MSETHETQSNPLPAASLTTRTTGVDFGYATRYGRRRLSPREAALRQRAARWCRRNRWRVLALNYRGVLALFRQQARVQHVERWTAHL